MNNILVIGAGAMGCLFAARLAESGAQVMLIDVDVARLDVIGREGITLTDDNGKRTVKLAVGLAGDVAGPVDLVLLFTKGMHSESAIRSVAQLAASGTFVLTLQNGLGNPEIVASVFPPAQILKGIAALPADLHGANGVSSHGRGHLEIGAMVPASHDAARDAATLLERAGFDARVNAEIDVAIWEKVAFNAALNALAAVTGQTNGGMNNAPGRRIVAAMLREVVATAKACGVAVDRERIEDAVDHALNQHHAHKASMLQDMIAGRRTEIESINGAVCLRADEAGVPVPVTRTMTDLVRLLEQVAAG